MRKTYETYTRGDLPKRFYEKIKFTRTCWLWTGGRRGDYGTYRHNKKTVKSHRFSWQFFNKEIPEGMFVCHKCDVPLCVNPHHLFLGTNKDNAEDMVAKGRHRTAFGGNHWFAKLKQSDVDEIRKTYQRGTSGEFSQAGLAKKFGVNQQNVSNVIAHVSWKRRGDGEVVSQ